MINHDSLSVFRVHTQQIQGMSQQELSCEAFALRGMQNFSISGLPDSILRDSKDKLRALLHSFVPWDPLQKLVVNLLPLEFVKCGAHLELSIFLASAIALSIELQESENLVKNLKEFRFYGGLSLDGEIIETTESTLLLDSDPMSIGARDYKHIKDLLSALMEGRLTQKDSPQKIESESNNCESNNNATAPIVVGRYEERLALLCGAILEEPVLLVGPPGVGKTYLGHWAKRLLGTPEDLQTLKRIWSLAPESLESNKAPFLNPHARAQLAEFVGYRRQNRTHPGYFSLCHQGLLLIDEFPELSRDIREVLRNVLDTREIKSLQGRHFFTWPAKFWLIATANPCACGEARPKNLSRCRCTRGQLQKYLQRFSGPLLDRIGIQLVLEKEKETSSHRVPPSLCQLLDANESALQDYVRKQRATLQSAHSQRSKGASSSESLNRSGAKRVRLKQVLENMDIDELIRDEFLNSWTHPFISPEHFR